MAHKQRFTLIHVFRERAARLAFIMRRELGVTVAKPWKKDLTASKPATELPRLGFHDQPSGTANAFLQDWKVRTWGNPVPTVGPDYRTEETPWAYLSVSHSVLAQPLAAMVRKIPGLPWFLAIESSLTAEQVDLVERDVASLVIAHARRGSNKYGGLAWVSGELPGERLYRWAMDDLPTTT
jgi:hypothetical protein